MRRVHIFISGKVQGVGYRFYMKRKAEELNINGSVQNTHDNSVEAVAEGEDEAIQEFIRHLRKGPFMAKIEKIDIQEEKPEGDLSSFDVFY